MQYGGIEPESREEVGGDYWEGQCCRWQVWVEPGGKWSAWSSISFPEKGLRSGLRSGCTSGKEHTGLSGTL